ncbi:MAG: potassium/proton antiporter [Candidatus Binatia bacterium]
MGDEVVEFTATALTVAGVLLLISSLFSRVSARLGVPVSLFFLLIGMLAGSDGPGGIWFDSFEIAYACGTVALVVILFAGGLSTDTSHMKGALAPASVLATIGVVGVAGLTALGARALGLSWPEALLVGAILSPTDAAAVFAVLDGVPLRRRVAMTIELESGLNDPVAVILTVAAALNLAGRGEPGWSLAGQIVVQLLVGAGLGLGTGAAGRWLLRRIRPSTPALYPAVTMSIAFVAYGVATQLGGSGFLSVYLAGITVGQGGLPHRLILKRFHESQAWLAQIGMFLMLGLLIFPSELPHIAGHGLFLALYLALVARPVAVALCLLPFRFNWREIACIAWVGLRGAVPIVLATIPVLMIGAALAPARNIIDQFDLVFFAVVVGAIIPGATVRWLPKLLGLEDPAPPVPAVAIDITSDHPLRETQLNVLIGQGSPACGQTLAELDLPSEVVVMGIVRGDRLLPPRGATRLEAGDHAVVLCAPALAGAVTAIFSPVASA